jgi:hypothetical protein
MKVFKFIVKNWFILLISYFLFVFVDSSIEDFKVEKYGVETNAVVQYYDKMSHAKIGTITYSVGFYRVDNKSYMCVKEGVIPINSTFKVKFYPKNPKIYRVVEEQ